MKLPKGKRVRSGAHGATYGMIGVITEPRGAIPGRIYIHWEGNVLSNGYLPDSQVIECLQEIQ
jgi:hypothetical protein